MVCEGCDPEELGVSEAVFGIVDLLGSEDGNVEADVEANVEEGSDGVADGELTSLPQKASNRSSASA